MTADTIENIEALLARYVAGVLPEPARVLVASHLELSDSNRPFVGQLEAMAGRSLESVAPIELGGRDKRLEAIFASLDEKAASADEKVKRCGTLPSSLQDFIGMRVEDIPWRTKLPGFKEYDLGTIDGCDVHMFWIKPGRAIPAHTHEGNEFFLVLDGAFRDATGRYGRGDISVADDTVDHRPVAEKDRPCIGFSVTDAPLRLTGSITQRIGDLLG